MRRKSLNDLVKRIANMSLYLYLPGITQDHTLTRTCRTQHFEVAISQSLDHYYTSCWEQGQTYVCVYSDTDWAGDIETSRSTTGYAIFLGNGIVSWLSRRQRRVTLSSTEVEYCSMTETAKQLRWIRKLYEELGFKRPLPLCVDNQGAIFLASNPAQEGRTKHIQMTEHFIRESVEFGEIKLYYVRSYRSAVH